VFLCVIGLGCLLITITYDPLKSAAAVFVSGLLFFGFALLLFHISMVYGFGLWFFQLIVRQSPSTNIEHKAESSGISNTLRITSELKFVNILV